jgi:cytoskeletal protein CcmA (bactofilin family)
MSFTRSLIALLSLLFITSLQAQDTGETVSLRGVINEDAYAAGGTVFSSANIQGDLIASGGTVLVDGKVDGDTLLFASSINVSGAIGDDLRAMGGTIIVNSEVGGDVVMAGGQLNLGPRAKVNGRAMLAGGSIEVAGDVQHGLNAAGGKIIISGHIHGDVDLEGGEIEILEGARIDGNLTYRSQQEAKIDPQAQIQGSISYQPSEWQQPRGPGNWFFMLTLAIAAIVFYLLFPGYSVASGNLMNTEFWKSLGFGLVVLLVIPFIAIFSMSIVIGLWLGLPLLALYFVALVIGSMLGMVQLGDWLARLVRWEISSRGRRVVSIIVAFILLGIVQLIPFLGGLATFIILLLGLGAGTIVLFRNYLASSPSTV